MGRGLKLSSGRVIALGRLLIATLFLILLGIDRSGYLPPQTYNLLIPYLGFSLFIALATWRNWWLDAQLAGPAHAADIALFTALVYLTKGEYNPFFPFFMFVLLSAAIRWGWRATSLSAILLTLLYSLAGSMLAMSSGGAALQRYVSGTGLLIILSLLLIWFGVNQARNSAQDLTEEPLADPSKIAALENGLRAAMAKTGASCGMFLWSSEGDGTAAALVIRDGHLTIAELKNAAVARPAPRPFLYNLRAERALMRDENGNTRSFRSNGYLANVTAAGLRLREGIAIPVFTERGHGQIYLESVRNLSTDHLELAAQLADVVATKIERRALMRAAEESAESRSRLAVARDLHDSVVQFLAGAAFRLEAMKRSEASGRDLTPDLNELKNLMLQEQGELRSFIGALRSGGPMELTELARDLQLLANRLSRQWDIQCTFWALPTDMAVAPRLHLDAQQLVREAVANAVRHAGAKNVSIRLAADADEVKLDVINDGSAFPQSATGDRMPRSLTERVDAAGGAIDLSRGMGVTRVSISLPAAGRAA